MKYNVVRIRRHLNRTDAITEPCFEVITHPRMDLDLDLAQLDLETFAKHNNESTSNFIILQSFEK